MTDRSSSIDGPPQPTLSGRIVVLSMFGFGFLVVGAMWLYWHMYQRPFRELQDAIAAEFENSSPQVIGGRYKSDERSPETLRIIVRVGFDPVENEERSNRDALRLAELARTHQDLSAYEVLEVHLRQPVPESAWRSWSTSRPVEEWLGELERPDPESRP